jgi:hypothetical protein
LALLVRNHNYCSLRSFSISIKALISGKHLTSVIATWLTVLKSQSAGKIQ